MMRYILLFLFVLLTVLPQVSFAGDDSYRSLKDIQENIKSLNVKRDNLQERWGKFFEENGKIKEFMRTDLSDEELGNIESMISVYSKQKNELEVALSKASKGGESTDNIKQEILKLKLDFYKQFVPFIQVSKLSEYLSFIKGNIEIVKSDKEIKEELYKEQQLYLEKVDSLREKIQENKKILDEKIRVVVEQRIQQKIVDITGNPDFAGLPLESRISIFKKVLEKIKERKDALQAIKDKTTILEKKIEIFDLFEDKIQETINNLK